MNPEQFAKLLDVLIRIADKRHAITEAADWPMLAAMVSMFGIIVIGLIGCMWLDLKRGYEKQELCAEKEHDRIWAAMKDCQEDCCPPRGKK